MAYENLKSAIKQAIKQNGNQEITGPILQNTLLSILNEAPSRIAFLVVGGRNEPAFTIERKIINSVEHIFIKVIDGGDVEAFYDSNSVVQLNSSSNVDYINSSQRAMFYVAVNVATGALVLKEFNKFLSDNEYFLFGFNIIFGANLPLNWVAYKGFDDNILSNKVNTLSNKVNSISSKLPNKLSRLAAIYVGSSEKCIKFTKENVEGTEHIKLYIKGDTDVAICYGDNKYIFIQENKTFDYDNVVGRKMFYVAVDVVTENFSIKKFNDSLGENEYFLFGFSSIFGANLPPDWVAYEGFDDNILSNKVNSIQETINKADSIFAFNPDYIYAPKIATLKKKTPYGYSPTNSPLVLLWFSDLHGNIGNLKRIIEWKNKYSGYIDDILNTGDTITDNLSTYNADFTKYLAAGGDKILIALGNHDVCAKDYANIYKGWSGVSSETPKTIYNKYIGKLNIPGIVKPSNAEIDGKNYYYKDYNDLGISGSGIRLIVLDSTINKQAIISSTSGASTLSAEQYQQNQETWFRTVLNDAKEKGFSVICAHHFNAKATEFTSDSGFVNRANKLNPIEAEKTPGTWLDKVDSFINSGGDFICWICGHTHQDYLSIIDNHPNQIQITITSSYTKQANAENTEPARIDGTKTQDAFNLISFDTYYKRIRLLRIGSNFDNFGHKLDMMCIDYKNKKIL